MNKIQHFMFTDIPCSGKGWTLVVSAVSLADAREYVKAWHTRGRFIGLHTASRSDFDSQMCGAVTNSAQEIISNELERMLA
jgi:hypothetical protein